jgi:O-antigen ligase
MNILLIIFFIIYFIITWLRADYALLMIALLLPSYLIRFNISIIPSTVLEVMIIILFFTWLIRIFIDKSEPTSCLKRIWFPWRWPVLFFIIAGTIAVFISPDTRQALGLWKAYIIEPVLLYLVFVNTVRNKQQIKMIVFGLGVSVAFVSLVTIWQYIGWLEIPGDYGFEIPKRATSVFPFPTAVGKYIGPLLGLFLGLLLVKNNEDNKTELKNNNGFWAHLFLWGVMVFGFIALLLSFSRGALVGVLAGIIFISIFSRWKKIILTIIAASVLAAFTIPVTRNSIINVFDASDTSADVHLVMWKGAIRIIKDNPITGTGLASFPVVYDQYKEASHTEYFPNPDHLILSLWIEMGLAGMVTFVWLVVKYFRSGVRVVYSNRKWAVSLLASMVVIIVHGLVDTPYFKNDLSVMFWILIGLLVVVENEKINSHR